MSANYFLYRKITLVSDAFIWYLNAWFHFDPFRAPSGIIYDISGTLSGIDGAIEMVLRKGYVGPSAMQEIMEERELNNFKRVLHLQIDNNPVAQRIVEIVDEF